MNVYDEVEKFAQSYPGKKLSIGKSEEGREIYAMFLGREQPPIGISQAAIHGREWITALLSLSFLTRGLKRGGFWVIPLMNPDGALLSQVGISSVSPNRRRELFELNGHSYDFSLWKANAEGVDLNVNFNASWGEGRNNVFTPAPENYVGVRPFCAAESLALKNFTQKICPDVTVSWHTKGEEIYWSFSSGVFKLGDRRLAKILSEAIGCPLREAKGSAGGYKDWCQTAGRIPSFTVEVGKDTLSHPIGREELPNLIEKYKNALNAICEGFHGRKIHARGDPPCRESQEEGGSSDWGGCRLRGEDRRKGI